MKARRFNSIMPGLNEEWAAKALGMEINLEKGPDLIDNQKNVEIKFCLTGKRCGAENYPQDWTVFEEQMGYNGTKPAFWGLGLYELKKPVSEIKSDDLKKLEAMVLRRNLWIVKWKWMYQFPPHKTNGETYISSWENTLRYPKLSHLPGTTQIHRVRKGSIYLTEGVDPEYFSRLKYR